MEWIVVAIVLLVIGGIAFGSSPTQRLWADKRPGKPGAVDPTGSPVPPDARFSRPPNEGDLL
jgi:hypothetical protein